MAEASFILNFIQLNKQCFKTSAGGFFIPKMVAASKMKYSKSSSVPILVSRYIY